MSIPLILPGAASLPIIGLCDPRGPVDLGDDGHLMVEVVIPAETRAAPYAIEADGSAGALASAA